MIHIWKKFFYRGIDSNTPKYLVISIIATNIALFMVMTLAIIWVVLSSLILDLKQLALIHLLFIFLTLFITFGMRSAGTRLIRIATAVLLVSYFSLINFCLGFSSGVEFYAAPVIFLVMIIVPLDGDRMAKPLRALVVLLIAATFAGMSVVSPFISISPDVNFVGYRLTIFFVFIGSWMLSRVFGIQVHQLLEELNRAKNKIDTALVQSEARYKRAARLTKMGHWIWDEKENKCIYCSEELAEMYGVSVEEYLNRSSSPQDALNWIHPDDKETYRSTVFDRDKNNSGYELTVRIIRANGQIRYHHEIADAVLDDHGNLSQTVGVLMDITESRLADEALRRAQKMDAVGKLTGGIAHDFNNILGIILGNIELLTLRMTNDKSAARQIESIRKSARRAAVLTRRLLSFSRLKPTETTITDINRVITGMKDLIARSLTPEVQTAYHFAEDLWLTEFNPGDFEDSLINLVLNSRDAMPKGGKIILETRNCTFDDSYNKEYPYGDYVELTVTDTGEGILPEHREHLFEPFFTTKKSGKGTGLGLSMVYGFIKRSNGSVTFNSDPDAGTTFKLYFPRALGNDLPASTINEQLGTFNGGAEVLLIVDDEEDLLETTKIQLNSLGYRVLIAGNGPEALSALDEEPSVALMFSDLVMPGGMNGYELAEQAVSIRPKLKVLLTSGYSDKILVHSGQERFSHDLLSKPYSFINLAQRIRSTLDND